MRPGECASPGGHRVAVDVVVGGAARDPGADDRNVTLPSQDALDVTNDTHISVGHRRFQVDNMFRAHGTRSPRPMPATSRRHRSVLTLHVFDEALAFGGQF